MIQAKEAYSKIGMRYTLTYILYLAIWILALYIIGLTGLLESLNSGVLTVVDMVLRFAMLYPLMYLVIRNVPKFDIPKKKLGAGRFIVCAIIGYTIMYLSNLFGMFLNGIAGRLTGKGAVVPLLDAFEDTNPTVWFIFAVFLAPVFEELLFRKFIIDRVGNFGELPAMLISGLMFGLFHQNLSQFVYATTLGMFFAFIYIRTGRVIYTILLHMIINGINTLVTRNAMGNVDVGEMTRLLNNGDTEGYMQFVRENSAALTGMMFVGLAVIILVIVGIVLMIVNRKRVRFAYHPGEVEKGHRFNTTMVNPGMLLYTGFFVAMVVLAQFGIDIVTSVALALGLI